MINPPIPGAIILTPCHKIELSETALTICSLLSKNCVNIDDLTGQSKPLIRPNIVDKIITIDTVSKFKLSTMANMIKIELEQKEVIIIRIFFSNLSAITPPKKFIIIVPSPNTAATKPKKNSDPLML